MPTTTPATARNAITALHEWAVSACDTAGGPLVRELADIEQHFGLVDVEGEPVNPFPETTVMGPLTLWAVNAVGLPMFYLDAQVQGIVDEEHALRIAKQIVGADARGVSVMAIHYDVTRVDR